MSKQWNGYQDAIFTAVRTTDDNLIVKARAGTGKTTTIVEALNHVPRGKRTMLCAFNKSIQVELQARAPKGVDVKTLHSIGFGVLSRNGRVQVNNDKTRNIIKEVLLEDSGLSVNYDRVGKLLRLVGLAKNMLRTSQSEIERLAHERNIEDEDHPAEELASQAARVIERCAEQTRVIDFDDMVWLPAHLKMKPSRYDVLFVDEAQDLNPCQRWMVEQLVRDGGRIIAVGDDRQAIYSFRGAGKDVLTSLQRQFAAKVLPLSITYRCAKKIVAIAQRTVPDYQAAPDAPEGEVLNRPIDHLVREARPGDFVLSRSNAPLMKTALSLLKANIPAVVTGRDIGASLATLARKSKAKDVVTLTEWLKHYVAREQARLLPDHEAQFEQISDRVDCLLSLCEGEDTVEQLCLKIEGLFTDSDDSKVVTCSTVHKAKGLERDRVFLLASTFRDGSDEESNINYVAVTRARSVLVYVED